MNPHELVALFYKPLLASGLSTRYYHTCMMMGVPYLLPLNVYYAV